MVVTSRWSCAIAIGVALVCRLAAAEEPAGSFEQSPGRVEIKMYGMRFATYVYEDSAISRPYFMNVRAPGLRLSESGVQTTRNQPPVAGTDLMDHPTFHPGIWLAFGDLSGTDSWRLTAPVKHVEFVVPPTSEIDGGIFTVRNRYMKSVDSDEVVCEELFAWGVRVVGDEYLVLWDSTFSSDKEFYFGDQEEMGLGIRVATAIRAQHNPDSGIAGGNGTILDSKGRKDEKEVWGKTADWCDYSGVIDGQRVGMTIFCHPENFRASWFHARDRGLLEANPFGVQAFTDGGPSKVVVKPGETLRLRYGILVHASAEDAAAPDLNAAYKTYLDITRDE